MSAKYGTENAKELTQSAEMYTKEDVERIFNENKFLIGNRDLVPVYIAKEIFGQDAVQFSRKVEGCCNGYGIGGYTLKYVTLRQLEAAATYCNVTKAREIENEVNIHE